MAEFKVGDTVYYGYYHEKSTKFNDLKKCEVIKVGRYYVYVDSHGLKFHMDVRESPDVYGYKIFKSEDDFNKFKEFEMIKEYLRRLTYYDINYEQAHDILKILGVDIKDVIAKIKGEK